MLKIFSFVIVISVHNDGVEQALLRLKYVLQKEGIFRELKRRKAHRKSAERKKEALNDGFNRRRKQSMFSSGQVNNNE